MLLSRIQTMLGLVNRGVCVYRAQRKYLVIFSFMFQSGLFLWEDHSIFFIILTYFCKCFCAKVRIIHCGLPHISFHEAGSIQL